MQDGTGGRMIKANGITVMFHVHAGQRWCIAAMARAKKVNIIRWQPAQYWTVPIHVQDAACAFSVHGNISYDKVFHVTSAQAACKAAAKYCHAYAKQHVGTHFSYCSAHVKPYFYHAHAAATVSDL